MKKIILMFIMVLSVTMIVNVNALASEVSPTPTAVPNPYSKLVIRSDGSVNINQLYNYYFRLNDDQRQIVKYLIGLSDYMYIGARGFIYENINETADLVSRLVSFGERFFGDGDALPEHMSRLTPYMQQMIASFISYANSIDVPFTTWIEFEGGDPLYIPYDKSMLDGWSYWYSDSSALGVSEFGVFENEWYSGSYYDFPFGNLPASNADVQATYNNFILNNSPVLYTNPWSYNNDPVNYGTSLAILSFKDTELVDTLYVKRAETDHFTSFRYGTFDGRFISHNFVKQGINKYNGNGGYWALWNITDNYYYRTDIINISNSSFNDLVEYAFDLTPIYATYMFHGFYPYISHVVLVDDLNTLSNREEVFSTTDLGINAENEGWINVPNDDLYYSVEPTLVTPDLWDILYKEDNNNIVPADPTDISKTIYNNTTINNYDITAPGAVINVPSDWLESDGNYLDYTNTVAFPFFVMVGDIFNALGEIRIFIIGVLILGLAGGILVKFLL